MKLKKRKKRKEKKSNVSVNQLRHCQTESTTKQTQELELYGEQTPTWRNLTHLNPPESTWIHLDPAPL